MTRGDGSALGDDMRPSPRQLRASGYHRDRT